MVHLTNIAQPDYYQLLRISQSASSAEIKTAYHHALLTFHPDKSRATQTIDIAQLKDAYVTLSSPNLRAEYDNRLAEQSSGVATGPRPAQTISLEEFDERSEGLWCHVCRCSGDYIIGEEMMKNEQHLVGCNSCSEVIWVGYEVVEEVAD